MTLVEADLLERVRQRVAAGGAAPTPTAVASALHSEGTLHGDGQRLAVLRLLESEIGGFGPLEPLVRDESVTDVLVNGPAEVWVDRGEGLERVSAGFPDESAVRRFAQRLAAGTGRRLDDAQPWVDGRLPGGVRLHAVLPPVAVGGTCVSLRVPRRRTFTLDELVAAGTMPRDGAELLAVLLRSRSSLLVSGATGSGKTTLLSTLLGLADPQERLLLLEEAAELRPDHPHVVRLEARRANAEGAGAVALEDLVRQALRMRPDRIVVGEVRGAEVVDLLAALGTGHRGGAGTVHANSAADVPLRLEALGAAAGVGREALHLRILGGLDAVVHLHRPPAGPRRVAEVAVVLRTGGGEARAVVGWRWDGRAPRGSPGEAADALRALLAGSAP